MDSAIFSCCQRGRREQVSGSSSEITYNLRSSILGGAVLTELNSQGGKKLTNVFAGGAVIAKQKVGQNGADGRGGDRAGGDGLRRGGQPAVDDRRDGKS